MINHFYCYCVDEDFGPFFLKFCSYFPFSAKLCINGNEWAKRQAAKAGLGFTPLGNAFAAADDPAALQAICETLGPAQIDALLRKWLAFLPHPFSPADRAAGYWHDISILLVFRLHPGGFPSKDLRSLLTEYLGRPPHGPGSVTPGQATYDLRRLREHGLIQRVPHTHRYQVTDTGLRHAMFLTRAHDRILQTGLAELTEPNPAPLRKAARIYQTAIGDLAQRAGVAA